MEGGFPPHHKLHSFDFMKFSPDSPVALFLEPPSPELSAGMNGGNWMQLWYHSASDLGQHMDELATDEILTLATSGNFAQLIDNHYWPYPTLDHEHQSCLHSLRDLGRIIWRTIAGKQHSQFLRDRSEDRERDITDLTLEGDQTASTLDLRRPSPGGTMKVNGNALQGQRQLTTKLSTPSSVPILTQTASTSVHLTRSTLSPLARCWYPASSCASRPHCSSSTVVSSGGNNTGHIASLPYAPSSRSVMHPPDSTCSVETQRREVPTPLPPHEILQRCYGISPDGLTRLSLGHMTDPLTLTLLEELRGVSMEQAYTLLYHTLDAHPTSMFLRYWKRPDSTLCWHTLPAAASGWFTLAYLRWRSIYGTTLDCTDLDDLRRASITLSLLSEGVQTSSDKDTTHINYAADWMLQEDRTTFLDHHLLDPGDLTKLCGHSTLALFLLSDTEKSTRSLSMPNSDGSTPPWAQLIYHSHTPMGTDRLSLPDLLALARQGEFAHFHEGRYWPYPVNMQEEEVCLLMLKDLAKNMWEIAQGSSHSNMLTHLSPSSSTLTSPSIPADATRGSDCSNLPRTPSSPSHIVGDPYLTFTPAALNLAQRLAHLKEDVYNTLDTGSTKDSHLRVATLNINGLEKSKLPVLLTYVSVKQIDVLLLQDTRLTKAESKAISFQIHNSALSRALISRHRGMTYSCSLPIGLSRLPAQTMTNSGIKFRGPSQPWAYSNPLWNMPKTLSTVDFFNTADIQ